MKTACEKITGIFIIGIECIENHSVWIVLQCTGFSSSAFHDGETMGTRLDTMSLSGHSISTRKGWAELGARENE